MEIGGVFVRKYIVKRILISIVILFFVAFIIYALMRCLPASYIENMARQKSMQPGSKSYEDWMEQLTAMYNMDKGIFYGFFAWLGQMLRGELGVVAATKQYSKTDYTISVLALAGISLPTFFFASLLKLLFSVKLGWFDLFGLTGRNYEQLNAMGQFLDKAHHLVLPIITLVVISVGSLMRYTRTNMLEVLNADYIRTARAKGLDERTVIYHHAFRNTLIPLVTIVGGSLPGLFSGALITETLYSIPGIGYTSYQAMVGGDIPFSMFYLTFLAILTLAGNLISDILYAVVDPRVRIS